MRNKRGEVPDLLSLSVATVIIAIILVLFIVLAGLVKSVEGIKSGEKIFKDVDSGVGNVRVYMGHYDSLVNAVRRTRGGATIEEALKVENYRQVVSSTLEPGYYRSMGGRGVVWGVFYG